MAAKRISARPGRVIHPVREAPDPEALRRGSIIESLQRTLEDEETFRLFPAWLAQVLQEELWRSFCNPETFEPYDFHEFEEFVRARRPRGLGVEGGTKQLYRECRFYADQGDADAKAALIELGKLIPEAPPEKEAKSEGGKKAGRGRIAPDNVRSYSTHGNSETYLLRRLKRDWPDLAEKVVHREMSARAAGVEAGFVKLMVQHEPTLDGFARAARKHLTDTERLQLAELLKEGAA
jgi:hypothetical protein